MSESAMTVKSDPAQLEQAMRLLKIDNDALRSALEALAEDVENGWNDPNVLRRANNLLARRFVSPQDF